MAGRKRKWFQVTHLTVRSPAGMRGLNMATKLPASFFLRSPKALLASPDQHSGRSSRIFLVVAGISERPFTRPPCYSSEELPRSGVTVPGLFLRLPRPAVPESVRRETPLLAPAFASAGRITTSCPLSGSGQAIPIFPRASTPRRGFDAPSAQTCCPVPDQVANRNPGADFPSLPESGLFPLARFRLNVPGSLY